MKTKDLDEIVSPHASAVQRMDVLARLAESLAKAASGFAAAGLNDEAKEFASDLKFVSRRLAWVEKTADPDWSPYKKE